MKKLFLFLIIFILLINNQYVFASPDKNEPEYLINKIEFFNNQAPYQSVEKIEVKNQPWYLSFIIPGLGQIIMGDFLRGLKYLVAAIIVSSLLVFSILAQSKQEYPEGTTSRGEFGIPPIFFTVLEGIDIALLSIIYIFNAIDAYNFNKEIQANNESSIGYFIDNNKFSFNNRGISYNLVTF